MKFFLFALTLLLITLKLIGVIATPWLWVLAPIWLGITLMYTIGLACIITASRM